MVAVRELFHICFWLARTYAKGAKPADGLTFDPALLPKTSPVPPQTLAQLQQLEAQLAEKDTRLTELLTGKDALDAELERLRAEIAAIKKRNAATPDTHDYSEAETRDYFIDLLLKEAGWPLDKTARPRVPVDRDAQRARAKALWITCSGAMTESRLAGRGQAHQTRRPRRPAAGKLYADCLEKQFGQRPSSSTPTVTSIGSGMTSTIRRARCRASTRRTNWSC